MAEYTYAGITNKTSVKRKGKPLVPNPLKKAPFLPHPTYIQMIEKHFLNRNITHTRPKSQCVYGLRVLYSEYNPILLKEVSEACCKSLVNVVSVNPVYLKGYFDLGFANAYDADIAASTPIVIDNHIVPTLRTRWSKDQSIYITFTDLPLNLAQTDLENLLGQGLSNYGEVTELHLQTHPIFPTLATSTGYAIINPNNETKVNITTIPRKAFFDQNNQYQFNVYPDRAPPICSICNFLGHQAHACPNTLEGNLTQNIIHENNQEETMENSTDAFTPFEWG